MTAYRFKDKSQVNIRLSHFLINGIDILGAKLDMSRSEIARLAIYEFVKGHFTKQEMDVLADRDDVVEEWVAHLKDKQSGTVLYGYDDDDFVKQKLKEEEIEEIGDPEENKVHDEHERLMKPIREKYAFIHAHKFMDNTLMNAQEAAKYFANYDKDKWEELRRYQKETEEYMTKKYPKEIKEFESNLGKLSKKDQAQKRRYDKITIDDYNHIIAGYQKILDDKNSDERTKEDAKIHIKIYQDMIKDITGKKKHGKKKT